MMRSTISEPSLKMTIKLGDENCLHINSKAIMHIDLRVQQRSVTKLTNQMSLLYKLVRRYSSHFQIDLTIKTHFLSQLEMVTFSSIFHRIGPYIKYLHWSDMSQENDFLQFSLRSFVNLYKLHFICGYVRELRKPIYQLCRGIKAIQNLHILELEIQNDSFERDYSQYYRDIFYRTLGKLEHLQLLHSNQQYIESTVQQRFLKLSSIHVSDDYRVYDELYRKGQLITHLYLNTSKLSSKDYYFVFDIINLAKKLPYIISFKRNHFHVFDRSLEELITQFEDLVLRRRIAIIQMFSFYRFHEHLLNIRPQILYEDLLID